MMVLLYHKATHFVDLNPLSYRETNTIQYHPIPEKSIFTTHLPHLPRDLQRRNRYFFLMLKISVKRPTIWASKTINAEP
jgi:hypothetical protein